MEFLAGLKEAMAQGVSKDEYMEIWSRELKLRQCGDTSQDSAHGDGLKTETSPGSESVLSLLKQIHDQQNTFQAQQFEMQQQMKQFQLSYEGELKKMHQQIKTLHDSLHRRNCTVKTDLEGLHQSLTDCVQDCEYAESLDLEEKVSLIVETVYNHLQNKMKNTTSDDCMSKEFPRTDKVITKDDPAENDFSEDSTENGMMESLKKYKDNTDFYDNVDISPIGYSGNEAAGGEGYNNQRHSFGGIMTGEKELITLVNDLDSIDQTTFFPNSKSSDSFKHTLKHELNAFLVAIQKLLLKPITSEDLSCHITEGIKKHLEHERKQTRDLILNMQTVICDDIHARNYSREMINKQELKKISPLLEQSKQLLHEVGKMFGGIQELKELIFSKNLTVPSSEPCRASETMEEKNDAEFKKIKIEENKSGPTPINSSKIIVGKEYEDAKENGGHLTGLQPERISFMHVQELMLTLLMETLMLLLYHDTLFSKGTKLHPASFNSAKYKSDTSKQNSPMSVDSENVTSEMNNRSSIDVQQNYCPQESSVSFREEPEAILKETDGHYKKAHYLCNLKCVKLNEEKNVIFLLEDIPPGYNLQLKAYLAEKNQNVNFSVSSVCGSQDDILIWPAIFELTIRPVFNQLLTASKKDLSLSFTKVKVLNKPAKQKGHSEPIPVCFFKDDVLVKFIHDNTINFKISVLFIRNEK